MALAQRFLRGSVLNLADQALRFVAVFIMTPIMIGILGDERYGFWVLLMSIVGHYSLLDFGLSFSISRFFSLAIGARDDRALSVLVSTCLSMFFKIGLIVLVLTLIGLWIVPLFGIDKATVSLTRWILAIYGIFLSVGFPVRVYRSLLKSHLRYDLLVLASAFQVIIGNALIYWFLTHGYGLLALAVINVCAGFLEYAIVFWAGRQGTSRGLEIRRTLIDPGKAREILRYSSVMFINQLGVNLRMRMGPIIIGSVVGLSAVTLYAVGTRFPLYLTDVVGAVLGGQLLALFGQSQGRTGSVEQSTRQLIIATRISSVIAVFCGSAMVFYGRDFIARWMGCGYEVSFHILVILTVSHLFLLMQYPGTSYIYSMAKHRHLAIMTMIGGAANLILSLVLVRFLGVYGVVWATLIEMLVVYLVVFPMMVCRVGGIKPACYYGDALARPLLLSLAILVPYYCVAYRFLQADYLRLAGLGILQALLFAPLAWFLVLRESERALFLRTLKRRN